MNYLILIQIFILVIFGEKSYSKTLVKGNEIDSDSVAFNLRNKKCIRAKIIENRFHYYEGILDSANNQTIFIFRKLRGNYFRNKGEIVAIDNTTDTVNWKMNTKNFTYFVSNGRLILTRRLSNALSTGTFCFDLKTGKKLWTDFYETLATYDSILLTRSYSNSILNPPIEAVTISKPHKFIWQLNISGNSGFYITKGINDTTIVINSSTFNLINPFTGKGWSIVDKTTTTRTTDAVAAVATTALLALTGTIYIPGNVSTYGLHSNLAFDSSNVYYASLRNLFCFDFKGNKIWETKLNEEITSQSKLFVSKYNITLLNFGGGYHQGRYVNIGKPYIAVFEKEYGREKLNQIINSKEHIFSFNIDSNRITTVFSDKIFEFDVQKNIIIFDKEIDSKTTGKLVSIYGRNFVRTFLKRNEKLISLSEAEPNSRFISNENNELLLFDSNFNFKQKINSDSIYSLKEITTRNKIFYNKNHNIVTDINGKTICEFDKNGLLFFNKNKLYYINKRTTAIVNTLVFD